MWIRREFDSRLEEKCGFGKQYIDPATANTCVCYQEKGYVQLAIHTDSGGAPRNMTYLYRTRLKTECHHQIWTILCWFLKFVSIIDFSGLWTLKVSK